jgi:uncharacterized protein (DUF983 family)
MDEEKEKSYNIKVRSLEYGQDGIFEICPECGGVDLFETSIEHSDPLMKTDIVVGCTCGWGRMK